MADLQSNEVAAAAHIREIVGPTILMGDGSYFDYVEPDASAMTIEDYAWGLATNIRFRGQTRISMEQRCAYNVAQHVVVMAEQMLSDGCTYIQAFEGLMHESDEVPWPDIAGPAKKLLPQEVRDLIKKSGDAVDTRFGVTHNHKALVKQYDIRMLATEKRDLMPQGRFDRWEWTRGFEPFDFKVEPWSIEHAANRFLMAYQFLAPRAAVETGAHGNIDGGLVA